MRNTLGLKNLKIMIPFCRRLDEAETVLEVMAKHGLARGQDGLEVYVMCEIPNNVILIDRFAELFDGFSIGSNDLTQLTLGVDRDSEMVAFDFDERDPGVLEILKLAVEGAKRNHRHSGICGQALQISRNRGVSGATWHRLDEPHPRHGDQDHAGGARPREEARPRSPTANAGSNRLSLPGASPGVAARATDCRCRSWRRRILRRC